MNLSPLSRMKRHGPRVNFNSSLKKSFTCIGICEACYRYEAPVSSMNELGPWVHLNSLIRSLYRMIGISPSVHFT